MASPDKSEDSSGHSNDIRPLYRWNLSSQQLSSTILGETYMGFAFEKSAKSGVRTGLLSSSLLAIAMVSSPALAQETPAQSEQAAAEAEQLDAITVTARRRSENQDRVPSSVAAIGAEQLILRAINSEADLQRSVPGLTIRESLSQNQLNYSIRGQSVDAYSSSSPGVLPYFNEFQVTNTSATSFIDIESVQVVKGPQGTLFGRNTTGGAVLYATAKPTNEVSGSGRLQLGNYDLKSGDLIFNLPLISDKVLLRVAGTIRRRDGFQLNTVDGSKGGEESSQTGRVTLLLRPSNGLENTTMFQYNSTNGTNVGSPIFNAYACGTLPSSITACTYSPAGLGAGWPIYLAANPGTFPGGLSAFADLQARRGPYEVSFNSRLTHNGVSKILTNTTTYDASDTVLIKNIFGFSDGSTRDDTDVDGTPFAIYTNGQDELNLQQKFASKQWSNELQVQGSAFDKRLEYIVGGYVGYERRYFYIPTSFFDLRPLVPTVPSSDKENEQISRNQALFAHASYNFSDQLSIDAGLRYTWEQVRAKHLPRSLFGQLGFAPTGVRNSFSKPSWNIGLNYKPSNQLLLYVTHRGSWRSGGFNTNSQLAPGTIDVGGALFGPETTKDIEAGIKFNGDVGGLPARLTVAGYTQWVDNIQRAVYVTITTPIPLGPTALTANVPQARVSGFEVEGEIKPAHWLTIGGNLAFTDAKFNKNSVNIFGVTTNFGPFPDTPRWTGLVFAQVNVPLSGNKGTISARADVYAQSNFFFSSVNDTINPGSELPGYALANGRITWSDIGGSKFGAALFVNNAFNRVYYTGGLALGSVLGLNTAIPGRPRMWGGEVNFRF
jgi:iron complex outermembrane recepter protein